MDECWLDVTASRYQCGTGMEIAEQIRAATREELGLTVSVGVSFNKIFVKLGSDLKKPDAVTEITPEGFLLSNQLIVKLLEAQTDRRAEQTPWLREQVEQAEREPMPAQRPATFEEQFGRQGILRGKEQE